MQVNHYHQEVIVHRQTPSPVDPVISRIADRIAREHYHTTRVTHQEHMAGQRLHVTLNPEVHKALAQEEPK